MSTCKKCGTETIMKSGVCRWCIQAAGGKVDVRGRPAFADQRAHDVFWMTASERNAEPKEA